MTHQTIRNGLAALLAAICLPAGTGAQQAPALIVRPTPLVQTATPTSAAKAPKRVTPIHHAPGGSAAQARAIIIVGGKSATTAAPSPGTTVTLNPQPLPPDPEPK